MSQQTAKTLNQAKAQAFADRMLDTLHKAAAALNDPRNANNHHTHHTIFILQRT
jgi:hypothetical protein